MDWMTLAAEEAAFLKRSLVARHRDNFDVAAMMICRAILRGGKVMACGNGGSASDASHFVGELLGRFRKERASLPAVSLGSDPATVTAIANDYGYEEVFARQVAGLGRLGDVLLAISTSGKSPNVVNAALAAKARGVHVIALVGPEKPVSPLAPLADVVFSVPSSSTARIQEVHIFAIHLLCEMLDAIMLPVKPAGT